MLICCGQQNFGGVSFEADNQSSINHVVMSLRLPPIHFHTVFPVLMVSASIPEFHHCPERVLQCPSSYSEMTLVCYFDEITQETDGHDGADGKQVRTGMILELYWTAGCLDFGFGRMLQYYPYYSTSYY